MRLSTVLGLGGVLLAAVAAPLAAQQEVGGRVMDARTGRSLEGAIVAVQGGTPSTRTDNAGRFKLTGLSGATVTLSITMIGFRPGTQTANVGNTNLQITLNELAVNLGELVVTGTVAGAEKRTVGNSVTTVRAADVQEIAPSPDVTNLINARAPGVVVIPGSGQVGAGPRIKIRGTNSFSLNDQPLIYVDGVRVANDVSTGINVQAFGSALVSRLNDFSPDEIDHIEILKGPAAATLYGTEASNGVIQIFTKRGQAGGKPKISATVRQGTQWFSNPEGRIRQPVNMVNGVLTAWDPVRQEDSLYKLGLVSRPLFTNGYMMGYGANVGGGNSTVRYFAGATFDRDNGIEPVNNQRRLTTNLNLNLTPSDKWDLQASMSYVKTKLNQAYEAGAGGIWFSTLFGDPALVSQPERGFLFGPPEFQWGIAQPSQNIDRMTGAITINHRPTKWFSQRLTVGQDQTAEASEELQPYLSNPEWVRWCSGDCALGFKYTQNRAISYTTFDYNANAKFSLSDKIGTTTSFGAQYYRRRTNTIWAEGDRFPAPGLETVGTTAQTFGFDDFIENSTVGFFGQEQVAVNDKLYLTGALRVDNNSAFGSAFNWVVYPKFSASYVVAEGQTGMVNALKLRAAYGQAGQQPDAFAALRSYQAVTAGDGSPAIIPQFVGNPNLKPERGTEFETGLEAGLFDDKVAVDFTFYYQKTRDAILNKSLAPSTGFPGLQFVNIGSLRNMGFEGQISVTPIEHRNFRLQTDLNFSHNSNKVLSLGEGVDSLGTFGPKVGYPVDGIFRRKVTSAELDSNGKAINVLCDGGASGTDKACSSAGGLYLGVWDPRWEGSFSATVTLHNRLRLYGLVDFKLGNRHFDNNLRALCQVFRRCDENFNPQNYDVLTIAEIQSNNVAQSWVINKADFAKIREVSVGYSFPRRMAQWVGGQDATLTLSARNLHTFTGWSGMDPEAYFVTQLFTRLEQDNTPQLASFQATLNISF
jgi:TonB-linked SusC/RagA family outer membrane protein